MERSPRSDATQDADGSIENPIAQLNAARSRSLIDNSLTAAARRLMPPHLH